MPSRLVEQHHSMSPRRDRLRDLREMQAHALARAAGQDQARTLAVSRADRTEDVGRGRALVLRRGGTGATPRPAAGDRVLLPDPRLVGKPDLYGLATGRTCRDLCQTGGEGFLTEATAASLLA
jgi:hypothetical protein